MVAEGPPLEALLRRLAECPSEFLESPRRPGAGTVVVSAVIGDLFHALGVPPVDPRVWAGPYHGAPLKPEGEEAKGSLLGTLASMLKPLASPPKAAPQSMQDVNYLQCVLIACWLFHDAWFQKNPPQAEKILALFAHDLRDASRVTLPARFISEAERREEFARLALNAVGLRPQGESREQAQDRLTTLNSTERQRVLEQVRAAEERTRKIREEMARQAALEAAAKYNRE